MSMTDERGMRRSAEGHEFAFVAGFEVSGEQIRSVWQANSLPQPNASVMSDVLLPMMAAPFAIVSKFSRKGRRRVDFNLYSGAIS